MDNQNLFGGYALEDLEVGLEVSSSQTITDAEQSRYNKRRIFFKTVCKIKNKVGIDGEAEIVVP